MLRRVRVVRVRVLVTVRSRLGANVVVVVRRVPTPETAVPIALTSSAVTVVRTRSAVPGLGEVTLMAVASGSTPQPSSPIRLWSILILPLPITP